MLTLWDSFPCMHVFPSTNVRAYAYMPLCVCVCVCVGWLGGPMEEEMALWMVCAQRHSKEHSPRRPRALDCTTSNDRIKRGQQEEREREKEREREGNKATESGKEINWLCQWLSLLMGENIEKLLFHFHVLHPQVCLG